MPYKNAVFRKNEDVGRGELAYQCVFVALLVGGEEDGDERFGIRMMSI
jgi:hypothetical protein